MWNEADLDLLQQLIASNHRDGIEEMLKRREDLDVDAHVEVTVVPGLAAHSIQVDSNVVETASRIFGDACISCDMELVTLLFDHGFRLRVYPGRTIEDIADPAILQFLWANDPWMQANPVSRTMIMQLLGMYDSDDD